MTVGRKKLFIFWLEIDLKTQLPVPFFPIQVSSWNPWRHRESFPLLSYVLRACQRARVWRESWNNSIWHLFDSFLDNTGDKNEEEWQEIEFFLFSSCHSYWPQSSMAPNGQSSALLNSEHWASAIFLVRAMAKYNNQSIF